FLHFKLVYFYLLVGNIIALYSLALVLKVNYPPDRVALYLYPLFVGFLFFLLDDIEFKNVVKLKYLFCFLVVGAMVLNFCMNLNITHSSAWDYECLPYRFCETVERYNKQNKMQATINAYCSYEGVWAYRNNSALKNLNQISYTDFPSQKADFEIAMLENMAKDWQYDYDLIDFDPISKRYLLKRKHFLKRIPIYNTGKLISFKTREEFYAIKVLDSINPNASKTMLFSYKGKIKFEENAPSLLDIVINIEDEKSTIRYDRIPLLWHTGVEKGKWIAFEFNYYISDISPSARKYTTYFWNVKPKEYSIKEFSYTLSEMEE
ncbi:MAG TPA: hypothetical protein VNW06_06000, partial [Cytophagaceae bacterium]|nr:hypothetical protein [Cytophagaceae bacterium]